MRVNEQVEASTIESKKQIEKMGQHEKLSCKDIILFITDIFHAEKVPCSLIMNCKLMNLARKITE